jgi:hypothetical protein
LKELLKNKACDRGQQPIARIPPNSSMPVVADTNIVVSGLLWQGNPRRVLDAARDGIIELFTSTSLIAELADVP